MGDSDYVYALLTMVLILPLATQVALSPQWFVATDPGPGYDVAYGACYSDGVVYLVGFEEVPGNATFSSVFRVEARDVRDGSLRAVWRYHPGDYHNRLLGCDVYNGVLYAVGTGAYPGEEGRESLYVVALRAEDLEPIALSYSEIGNFGTSLTVYRGYLYVLGLIRNASDDYVWVVEKRTIPSLEVVNTFTYNPSPKVDYVASILGNPATGGLWVLGSNEAKVMWVALALSEDLEVLKYVEIPLGYYPFSACLEEGGRMYVVGYRSLAVLGPGGEVLKSFDVGYYLSGIGCSREVVYVVGWGEPLSERLWTAMLHVYDADLNYVDRLPLNVRVRTTPSLTALVINNLVVVPTHNVTKTVGGIRERYPDSTWVVLAFSYRTARPETSETPSPTRTPTKLPVTPHTQPPPTAVPPWLLTLSAVVLVLALLGSFLALRRAKPRS